MIIFFLLYEVFNILMLNTKNILIMWSAINNFKIAYYRILHLFQPDIKLIKMLQCWLLYISLFQNAKTCHITLLLWNACRPTLRLVHKFSCLFLTCQPTVKPVHEPNCRLLNFISIWCKHWQDRVFIIEKCSFFKHCQVCHKIWSAIFYYRAQFL